MTIKPSYDVAIIGGGLAGLSAAASLAREGVSVIVFEKEYYPFHRVCGEYVSMESWDYLASLGVPLDEIGVPRIHTLLLTAPNGKSFRTPLPLGGFGISRFTLDRSLAAIARQQGATVCEGVKVEEVKQGDDFEIVYKDSEGIKHSLRSRVCLASFGKRSNMDLKWKRPFLLRQDRRLQNYVGIKYHLQTDWEESLIGLHNFQNGYCGISKIEEDKTCLCYLTRADNLKNNGQSITQLEKTVLSRNPHLNEIFRNCEVMEGFPVTISQVNFHRKESVWDGALMMGDAAGMITPLCGNGMSIALHTGKIASGLVLYYLMGSMSHRELEKAYAAQWQQHFGKRLAMGRVLQRFFGSNRLSNGFVGLFRTLPFLANYVIRQTHGKPF